MEKTIQRKTKKSLKGIVKGFNLIMQSKQSLPRDKNLEMALDNVLHYTLKLQNYLNKMGDK